MPAPNSTFASDCYVPILPCRAAERDAITLIDDLRVAPLLVVRDPDVMATAIARAWRPHEGVLFVQSAVPSRARQLGAECSLAALFERLRKRRITAVPVLLGADAWNADAVTGIARRDGRGVMIRVAVNGVARSTADALRLQVDSLAALVACAAEDIDLLLDVRPQRTPAACAEVAAEALDVVRGCGQWRNLVVHFADRPRALNGIAGGDPAVRVARDDAAAYDRLLSSRPARVPVFADSGVRLPILATGADEGPAAQPYMRIINDVIGAPAGYGGRQPSALPMYVGTSWAPAQPHQGAQRALTQATLHHVGGVLSRLSDRQWAAAAWREPTL